MAIACDKCKAETERMTFLNEWGNTHKFCPLCIDILDNDERKTGNATTFMENHEAFTMTTPQRSMLNARLMRAEGKGVWSENT